MYAVAIASLCAAALLPVSGSPTFVANVSQTLGAFTPSILDCVGSGHGVLGTRADYQQHLAAVQRDITFKHIRGHGILDDDLSTYLDGKANLYSAYRVIDYWLSVNIKPIFEISFMPEELSVDPTKTIMHYKGGTAPPKDPAKWAAFITDVVQGCVDRYGAAEVRQWMFEVWNEPNGCGFFCPPSKDYMNEYFSLYNTTSRAVMAVDAGLKVGGPATAGLAWVPEFISYAQSSGAPAHIVTTHHYPTDLRHGPFNRTTWEDNILQQAAITQAAGLPLVMTEISAGLNNAYDSFFAAAFVVHAASAFLGVDTVPTLSYWTFSDVFEEPGMQSTPWAETFGIQTKWGVPKPAYRGLQLISLFAASPNVLIAVNATDTGAAPRTWPGLKSQAAQATATSGTVDVIMAVDASTPGTLNVHCLAANFNMNINNTELPSDGLPIVGETVTLSIAGLPQGAKPTSALLRLLDSTHGWAKPTWIASGSPTYPTPAEIAAEMQASQWGEIELGSPTVDPTTGVATITLPEMEPYAAGLVTLVFSV